MYVYRVIETRSSEYWFGSFGDYEKRAQVWIVKWNGSTNSNGRIKFKTLGTNTHNLPSSSLLLSRYPLEVIQKGFQPLIQILPAEWKTNGERVGRSSGNTRQGVQSIEIKFCLPLENFGQFIPPLFASFFLIVGSDYRCGF